MFILFILQRQQEDIRNNSIKIIEDLIRKAFDKYGNINLISSKVILSLCQMAKSEGVPPTCKEYFIPALSKIFTTGSSDFQNQGKRLIQDIEQVKFYFI